jgi:hypothetical protein
MASSPSGNIDALVPELARVGAGDEARLSRRFAPSERSRPRSRWLAPRRLADLGVVEFGHRGADRGEITASERNRLSAPQMSSCSPSATTCAPSPIVANGITATSGTSRTPVRNEVSMSGPVAGEAAVYAVACAEGSVLTM